MTKNPAVSAKVRCELFVDPPHNCPCGFRKLVGMKNQRLTIYKLFLSVRNIWYPRLAMSSTHLICSAVSSAKIQNNLFQSTVSSLFVPSFYHPKVTVGPLCNSALSKTLSKLFTNENGVQRRVRARQCMQVHGRWRAWGFFQKGVIKIHVCRGNFRFQNFARSSRGFALCRVASLDARRQISQPMHT